MSKLNPFNLKEHGSYIKQLLVKKSMADVTGNGREILFEQPVLRVMHRENISQENLHRFIRDYPITGLKPLNQTFSRYMIQISGSLGRKGIQMDLEMKLDRSGLDIRVVNLYIKH